MNQFHLDFASRLNRALDEKGIPRHGRSTYLSKKLNVTPKAANKWINGETLPTIEKLIDVSIIVEKTVGWLVTGIGDNDNDNDLEVSSVRLAMARYAPVISWAQVEAWVNMDSITFTGKEESLPLVPQAGKNSFYLTINGESNSPEFKHGEKICIDPDWILSDILNGEMILVRLGNTATFRALVVEPDGYYLRSLNPNFNDGITKMPHDAVFVGKYIGSFIPARIF